MKKRTYKCDDLVLVKPFRMPAILKSGGPIMNIISIDSDNVALCEWHNDVDLPSEPPSQVAAFPIICLYKLVNFIK
jgi:uncharacterized protein YodC (DUF2158 family)